MSEIHKDLSKAVNLGQLEKVKDLINRYGVYNSGAYGYYNLLRNAVKMKYTEITQLLLTSGTEENNKKTKIIPSNTPLHFAVLDEDLEIIEMLLDHGANINARNECGSSALLSAIRMAKGMVVDILLKRGTYRQSNNNSTSPLHVAIEQALFNIIEKFSMRESSMNSKTEDHIDCINGEFSLGKNAGGKACTINVISLLYIAVNNCHREADTFLEEHKAKIDGELEIEKSLLNCSVCKALSMIFEDIVKESPSPTKKNENNKQSTKTVTESGSEKNNVTIFENLLLYGFPVESSSLRELSVLKMNDVKQLISNLMQHHGIDLTCCKHENIILRIFTNNKQIEIIKFLFTHEPDAIDEIEDSPILYSTENTDANYAMCLLLQGVKHNIKFSNSDLKRNYTNLEVDVILENVDCVVKDLTPLQIATYRGNTKIVESLLENGVNVNSKRENGDTALHIVAKTCNIDVLKTLLENGADVCAKNNQGNTPLHAASMASDLETVSILLQNGSFVDSKNEYGLTPLRIAYVFSRHKKFELVKLLLHFGADISNCIIHNPSESYFFTETTRQGCCLNSKVMHFIDEKKEEKEQFRFILFHLIMLKTANLFVKEEHQQFIQFYGSHDVGKNYKEKCKAEIKSLKQRKFPNNNLSFYDILTKNVQYLARYAKNKDLIKIFESEHYKSEFPIYGSILERHLRRAIFYQRAQDFFYLNFELPHDCSENIFKYLCVTDIQRLMFGIRLYQPNNIKIDKILCSKQ